MLRFPRSWRMLPMRRLRGWSDLATSDVHGKITVELSPQDRALLKRIADALEKGDVQRSFADLGASATVAASGLHRFVEDSAFLDMDTRYLSSDHHEGEDTE